MMLATLLVGTNARETECTCSDGRCLNGVDQQSSICSTMDGSTTKFCCSPDACASLVFEI